MTEEHLDARNLEQGVQKIEHEIAAGIEADVKKTDAELLNVEKEIEERKRRIIRRIVRGKNWVFYAILAFIVWVGVYVRTRNLSGLKDITTNSWTLGPDLDPFLFLRYAKYIVEHGSLMAIDTMRYVPLGFETGYETKLLPYLIAYLYHALASLKEILSLQDVTVDFAGVIYPVVMFAFTTIVFFFFVKEVFKEEHYSHLIATVATLFLVVSPSLLSRTIAGIPEKESSIGFMFAAFYFFIRAWGQKNALPAVILAFIAGLMSALMGHIWGGFVYLYLPLSLLVLIFFLMGKVDTMKAIAYGSWVISFSLFLFPFTAKYTFAGYLTSPIPSLMYINLLMIVVHASIKKVPKLHAHLSKYTKRIPLEFFSLCITAIVIFVAAFIVLGPQNVVEKTNSLINIFTTPIKDRFGLTVAENRQPYFGEWKGSFGPDFKGIPLFFWLFFAGSIVLFYHMFAHLTLNKRITLTALYLFMLFGIIFSRYDPNKLFNGVNLESQALYFGSAALFLFFLGYYYLKDYREGKHELGNISYAYLFVFIYFFISLASARSAVRLIMMLSLPASIIVGFFTVFCFECYKKYHDKTYRLVAMIIAVLVIVAAAYTLYFNYQVSKGSASGFVPSSYTQQWQKAMKWVRDNTAQDAVFAHWWDYGYWVQSIGERATVLDGGNAIVYWDHLMGRHVLTGSDLGNSLSFLYTHKATHLLIDSTDIGKYGAYASIGGDEKNDRASFIPTLLKDDQKIFETRNETVYVYPSGFGLDQDILWDDNGSKKVFSSGGAFIAGVFIKIEKNSSQVKQPEIVIFDQITRSQTQVPLRYLSYNNTLTDFGTGVDAGIMIVPRIIPQQGGQVSVDPMGAVLYFSKRTVHSFMARLFLFGEKNEAFELVHSEPHFLIENLRQQGLSIGDFAYFGDILGPIRIWKIHYPDDIKENPEWLKKEYPSRALVY